MTTTTLVEENVIEVLSRIAEGFSLQDAFDELKQLGWKAEMTFAEDTSCYDKIWEHPCIVERDAKMQEDVAKIRKEKGPMWKRRIEGLKTNNVMGHIFCTLYRRKPEYYSGTKYKFCFGRMGDSRTMKFDLE